MSSESFRIFIAVMIVIAFAYTAIITRYAPVDAFVKMDRWTGEMVQSEQIVSDNRFYKYLH